MPRKSPILAVIVCLLALAPGALAAHGLTHRSRRPAHPRRTASRVPRSAGTSTQCRGSYPAARDPRNPLMLATPPGSDPLSGAPFFVDGPRHGMAAGTIARMLGLNPLRLGDDYSWPRLRSLLAGRRMRARLSRNHALARRVALLAKIASQPEEERFSLYSGGGGPGAVAAQVRQFFCHTTAADPGAVPIFTTYFLYQHGYCEPAGTVLAYRSRFERQVNEFAAAIGRRPAVVLLELDAIGASRCEQRNGGLAAWEGDIAYEIGKVAALPHVVAYVEAGYADGNPPGYTAHVLNAVGAGRIRGFFTNDTHNDWTIREIRWGQRISRLTHGLHFVVNTATNGRGPLLNRDPVHQGNEFLCNAPGRGLGPRPTANTGYAAVDAFLWTGVPGNSAGSCGGGPPAGTFWAARAIGLAARADGRLGPGFARDPY